MAALLVAVPPAVLGQIINGVYVSGSSPYGRTYAQWSAAWWQWNFSLPTTNSPIQDTAPISTGQTGSVWFLGGTFGLSGNQTRVRSGSVPEGTALFVGIAESWADNANCPHPDTNTTAQLRALAATAQGPAFAMSCTIDGLNTVNLNNTPNPYRVQSPVFNYTVPGVHNYLDDLFGATCYYNPGGVYTINGAVADGVYLMLAPLPPGTHTIQFTSSYLFSVFPFTVIWVQDITYNLTVVPQVAPVSLSLDPQGTNAVLSWPQTGTSYVLEQTAALPQANWQPAAGAVEAVGSHYQMTIPATNASQFFRLRKQ